jgi:hypothetical protein
MAEEGSAKTVEKNDAPLDRFLKCLKRALAGVLLLLLAVYVGDYMVSRIRIAKNFDPYGVVQVRRYYAVTMKNGKPDYFFEPPVEQTCVNALFPHFGYSPCWYLRRRATQQIKM